MKATKTIALIGFAATAVCTLPAAPRTDGTSAARGQISSETLAASSSISGEVASVDASGKSFDVKDARSGSTTTIAVDDDTFIMVDGKSAKLEDLQVGQTVVVTTEEKEGKSVASSISARSSSSRSGAPASPDSSAPDSSAPMSPTP